MTASVSAECHTGAASRSPFVAGYVVYSNVVNTVLVRNATKGKQKKKVELAPRAEKTDGSEWLKGTNVNFGDAKAKQRATKARVVAATPAPAAAVDTSKAL